jgi:formylglycine-generating enzyme required for sulfatase activity
MDMFNGAISFDQDISGWDISSEPSMTDMFGAEDGLSIYNKSKIQKSFAVSPRWGYEWEVNDPPHSLSEVEPLVVSTSQPIGTLVSTIRAENAESNESIEYAFVPMFDPFWAKNDNSMKVWLDAADASYIEEVNGAVLRWNNKTDQQPNLVPQEGGGNPTTGWRKHYGLNVLDFDGVSGLISPDAFDLGGNFSILMVAGIDQVDTNVDTLISSYRGGSPAHFYIRSAQEGVFNTRFQNNGMGSMRNFTPDSEMGPAIYEFIFNLEEEFLYCRINGEEYGKTGYWTAPDPFNYLRVFNKQGDGANRGYIDGFLAELLIFNKALLGGQRTEVENYLGAKWGIDVHIPKPTKNFELRANGEIYTTAVFDHDSEGDYEFQFRAMDEWNQTVEQALTIRVVNAVPDELNASGDLSVYENRPVGSIVSSFTGTDPDGDAFEIKLVDSNTTEAGNLFTIDQNGSLRTRVVLDYEIHGQTHPLVVEIVDEYGGKLVKEFAVSILNVVEDFDGDGIEDFYDLDDDNDGFTDEEEIAYGSNPNDRNSVANVAPEVPELFSELSMRENLPIGTYVGNVLAMDWDGDLREVWVVDVNGSVQESSFYIDTNGSLRTARILDFERTPVINFQILAIDEHNATTSQVFTLQIEDVYEPSEPNHLVEGAAGLEMIWVEPGSFLMGSPETEDAKHAIREQQHKVTLTQGYYLGKYEVTQEQYEKVMTGDASGLNAAPSKWKGSGNLPVEKVSVQDVKVFLECLNQSEHIAGRLRNGWAYVLPTEAEWEYACRAGTTSAYNFGDQISRNDANFENDISYPTVSVGQYLPNHWGFYDMHGNVAEWTSSYFGDYPLEAVIDPLGPLSGTNIVSRGGSWKNTADAVRSAVRIIAYTENQRVSHHGFRLAYKLITEPPHNLRTHDKLQVLENQPGGTFVGGFMSDEPNGDVISYHLVDGDGDTHNDYFYIDKNGSLRSLIPLDYEVNPRALSIRVQARDSYLASTERTFRVELLDESELISDSVAGEGGWNVSDWFGTYLPFPSGWVYHETLRWVYLHPDQAGGYWIWQNVMGWLWTKSDLYPYLWSHEKKEWLYLLRSDEEGILYYKYSDKTIHQFNDKLDIPVSKYPKFSWDHIPRYMHTYKLTDFEQEELEYLAQFPLITIEKAQAIQQGGNNFVQRGTTVAAEGIKALNPDAKVLYYKNIIIDWHGSDATPALEVIENSYLKKTDGEFLTIGNRNRKYFDVSMPAVRNWWIEDASRMLNEPSIDGLFIDAHPKILYDWWLPQRGIPQQKWEEVYAGYLTLLEKINLTFSSQNILLANLIRTSLSEQGGREHLHFFDGSYLEHFANDNLYDGKKADYIAMGINHVQQAAREGNIIAFTMKLGGEDGEEDLQSVDEVNLERLNYTTALFLVMAEKYSYFFPYGGTYGADAGRDATWMHTFPIFKKKLGPPKGPAVQEGYIYTREFENCRVILDIENEKGTLFWEEDSSR